MPKGPRGEYRPEDPASAAVRTIQIAVGEITEKLADKERDKDPSAVSLGKRGGLKGGSARAKALSPERRSEIAKRAASARWKDKGDE